MPDMDFSHYKFLLTLPHYQQKDTIKEQLLKGIKENNMVKYYVDLCEQFKWPLDQRWVNETTAANQLKLKELEDKIEDAVKNLGETEVRESHLAKSEFLCRTGEKDAAESAFRITFEKTVGSGQRLDIVFTLIRMGFFYDDKDLIKRNISKAKEMIQQGGDWDRRNRLKVYEAYYLMSIRQFKKSAELFLDTLATFSSEELFSYQQNVFYTVLTSIVSLDRVPLKEKVVDSPDVNTVIKSIPHLNDFLRSFYNSEYSLFFSSLAKITDAMKEDDYCSLHVSYFAREMRIRAYKQYLESYRSVQLKSIASAFGVSVEFIDRELSRFISIGRLDCKIDAVGGVVETIRPDAKNASYHSTIKHGDNLLNRIQKLSRVIHL
uniref:PCI domain-containing protein n=1 Tax=Arcella intermedia TaxID=1963864 RepID=A0A6B2L6T1_9EUKA